MNRPRFDAESAFEGIDRAMRIMTSILRARNGVSPRSFLEIVEFQSAVVKVWQKHGNSAEFRQFIGTLEPFEKFMFFTTGEVPRSDLTKRQIRGFLNGRDYMSLLNAMWSSQHEIH